MNLFAESNLPAHFDGWPEEMSMESVYVFCMERIKKYADEQKNTPSSWYSDVYSVGSAWRFQSEFLKRDGFIIVNGPYTGYYVNDHKEELNLYYTVGSPLDDLYYVFYLTKKGHLAVQKFRKRMEAIWRL